jgi:hypothetical protein
MQEDVNQIKQPTRQLTPPENNPPTSSAQGSTALSELENYPRKQVRIIKEVTIPLPTIKRDG